MTNPERAELDILRAEKSRWESLREEDRAERARLTQELNELRSQVLLFEIQLTCRMRKWWKTILGIYCK
jgi:hypothetical protein